jgi:hypothetical protein
MVRRLVTAGVYGDHSIEVDEHLPLAVVVQRRDLFGHTVDGSDGGLKPPRPGLGVLGFGNQHVDETPASASTSSRADDAAANCPTTSR